MADPRTVNKSHEDNQVKQIHYPYKRKVGDRENNCITAVSEREIFPKQKEACNQMEKNMIKHSLIFLILF